MSFLQELFRKEPSDETKKHDALQVWGTLMVLEEKTRLKGVEFKKLEKRLVPEGLREWKHYDDMPDIFRVNLAKIKDQLMLKVISGAHYYKLKIKNPYDYDIEISEGRLGPNLEEIPFPMDIKESPLKFAFYLSSFVFHHWRQSNPQVIPENK